MKRSEVALIAFVSVIVIVISFILGNSFFGNISAEVTTIEYLMPIDSSVAIPDEDYFNAYAHNPTVEVYVGNCPVGQVWDEMTLKCVEDTGEEEGESEDESSEETPSDDTSDEDAPEEE